MTQQDRVEFLSITEIITVRWWSQDNRNEIRKKIEFNILMGGGNGGKHINQPN